MTLQILDPIDGTTNFVHAMPLSAVSIGVAHRGKLVCGVIYDPFYDELFSAVVGGGALLNGLPIKVGPQATLGEAVVAAGAPPTGYGVI
jgi:myo-inositol-1(or 4)-monophosphatase